MNDNSTIDLHQLHAVGIPVGDLPEDLPHRDGCVLFALITNDNSMEFAVAIGDVCTYNSYRTKTHHYGDGGNWIFRKMELFFVPEGSLLPGDIAIASTLLIGSHVKKATPPTAKV